MEIPESGLLEKIRPPRLEDAGLEDCALPPESIFEAFQKAAALRSSSPDDDEVSEEDEKLKDVQPSTPDPITETEKEMGCIDELQGLKISDDGDQTVESETKIKGHSTES